MINSKSQRSEATHLRRGGLFSNYTECHLCGWQVTFCDAMWHVSSRSGVVTLRTATHLLLTYLHYYKCIDCLLLGELLKSVNIWRSYTKNLLFYASCSLCTVLRKDADLVRIRITYIATTDTTVFNCCYVKQINFDFCVNKH